MNALIVLGMLAAAAFVIAVSEPISKWATTWYRDNDDENGDDR